MGSGMKYTPEFRSEAVRQVVEYSRPCQSVATELGIKADTLRTWVSRARREGFEVSKREESDAEAEIRRLRKELKDKTGELYWSKQENEFLKKAAGFFAAESNPKRGSK